MKITLLSEIDYAGSGHKLYEAIKTHTDHDIEIYTGKYYNPYKHPSHSRWNKREVQARIDSSNIVHLKGDFPPQDPYLGLKIMHRPVIITVSGSHFRKQKYRGHEKYKAYLYKQAYKTAFEPDLLYPEYSDVWTPHPINSEVQPIEWNHGRVLMHIPSDRRVKGTEFIMEVFKGLRNVEIATPGSMVYRQAVEIRKRASIYFDQFGVGFYGNAALEAMQYGIPTAAWISPLAKSQAKGVLNDCPVITTNLRVKDWIRKIESVLDSDLEELSRQTKIWCDAIHGYSNIAAQWDEIYTNI